MCDCSTGFDGDGINDCVDIDECDTKTDDCSPVQNCENTEVLNFTLHRYQCYILGITYLHVY